MTFDVCRAYFNSVKSGLHGGRFQDDLKNVFAGKSTSTLHNRAGPFLRYLHFCSCSQLSALPLSEDVVYAFMQSEENRSAPTFLKSFMSSLAFACHAVGLLSAKHVIDSKRVKGLVDRCYLLKRKTRSRQPLRVDELATLEEIVVGRKTSPLQTDMQRVVSSSWFTPEPVSLTCSMLESWSLTTATPHRLPRATLKLKWRDQRHLFQWTAK